MGSCGTVRRKRLKPSSPCVNGDTRLFLCDESIFPRTTEKAGGRSQFRWFVHTAPPYNEFWDYSFRSAELNLPIRPDSVLISNSRFETDLKGLLAHLCCDPWSNRKGQSCHLPSKYFTDFKKSSVSVGSSQ